ncbi:TIGR03986 family type III CRISPR-associated RAMP protein [Rhodobacter capsulatus]|uniref:TIGR03986 family type III CRISPR-associated RAMP protein n=1 Tax=Rhodobacter capsulatus TaxID=1061 RepID=UPI0003D35F64|nr:TIGR03986 family CRISPR-associated RAMP protein [Rhodobacter capsulatus]ETD79195.1 hypothetical protein U716_14955 [Rhodobacter capsulatus B6]
MNYVPILRDIAAEYRNRADYLREARAFLASEGASLGEAEIGKVFDDFYATKRAPLPGRAQPGRGHGTGAASAGASRAGGALPSSDWYAPFRFVSLSQRIAFPEDPVKAAWADGHLHDRPLEDGLCATLSVTWEFDGPMLIGDGGDPKTKESDTPRFGPLKVAGHYVLPGSSLRGLLRSTLEIAAMGRLEQVDGHRAFGMRDFTHKLFKDDTRPEVKGGWLQRTLGEDGKPIYEITPCKIHEIRIRDMRQDRASGMDHAKWLTERMAEKYADLGMCARPRFKDDFPVIGFDRSTGFTSAGEHLVRRSQTGSITGVFVCAGRSPTVKADAATAQKLDLQKDKRDTKKDGKNEGHMKKVEYVFETRASDRSFILSDQEWRDFLDMNSTITRDKPRPAGNWKELSPTLEAGKPIPVFWIGTPGESDFDFGLVKVFKRRMKHRLRDLIPAPHGQTWDTPDFVQTLMGFVREPGPEATPAEVAASHDQRHLRSRLSVGFAKLVGPAPQLMSENTVQAVPKPSFGPFYLRGTPLKDWNEPVKIAGRKRYPAFGGSGAEVVQNLRALVTNDNRNIQSHLTFLSPAKGNKLRFTGEIRAHNVTPAELGAVIWALTLGGDPALRHAIGRAKAQGAGQARVAALSLHVVRNDGAPISESPAAWEADFADADTGTGTPLAPFVQAFGAAMRKTDPQWPDIAPVQELLGAADPKGKGHDQRGYMGLGREAPSYPELRKTAYDKGKGHSGPDCMLSPPRRSAKTGRKEG